jgi:hypothetical protein
VTRTRQLLAEFASLGVRVPLQGNRLQLFATPIGVGGEASDNVPASGCH